MEKVGEKISYDSNKELGRGGFAIVYEGLFESSKKVAVKRIQQAYVNQSSLSQNEPENETKIMLEVSDHQNILRYICYETDRHFLFIATELCAGTLNEWVEGAYKGPEIGMNERNMLHQVTKGLAYLHSKNIIHRDIKPTNILIFVPDTSGGLNEPQMKITDFGLSKVIQSEQADLSTKNKTNPRGTRGWIAPELYEEDRRYDFKVDIFPLGCLFGYTLSKGKHHPFGDDVERPFRIMKKLEPVFLALEDIKEPYSNDLVALELIKSMIQMEPTKRPSSEDILINSFFTADDLNRPTEKLASLVNWDDDQVINKKTVVDPVLTNDTDTLKPFIWVMVAIGILLLIRPQSRNSYTTIQMKKFLELSYESLMGLDGTRYTDFLNVTCPGKNFESVSKDGDIIELDKNLTKELLELSSTTSRFEDYEVQRFYRLVKDPRVDLNARDPKDEMNALLKLSRNYGHRDLLYRIEYLIEKGIDINATDPDGWNALHNVCARYDNENLPAVIMLLRECNIDLEAKTNEGYTALYLAAFNAPTCIRFRHSGFVEFLSKDEGFFELVKDRLKEFMQLIGSRSKLTDKEVARFTQLVTDMSVDINLVIILLSMSPKTADTSMLLGENALHALFRHYKHDNLIDLVRILTNLNDTDVSASDSMGRNILHYLFRYYEHDNMLELVQFLLEYRGCGYGHYCSSKTKTGWSPLHVLFRYYRYDNLINIVKLLIEKTNVNFFATNVRGWTPLHHLCRYYKHDDLLDIFLLLKEHGHGYSMTRLIENTTDGHSASYLLKTVFWNEPKNKDKIIEMLREDKTEPTVSSIFFQWITGSIDDSMNEEY